MIMLRAQKAQSAAVALCVAATLSWGCAVVGPASIANGRAAYTDVITRTNDQQLLTTLVRMRYAETSTLLMVSSITAQSEVGVGAGGQVGIGPKSNYAGNLVPLTVEGHYRETPTISYTPIGGERYLRQLLLPIELDLYAMMIDAAPDPEWMLTVLTRGLAGFDCPVFAESDRAEGLAQAITLLTELRHAGVLSMVFRMDASGKVTGVDLTLDGYAQNHMAQATEFMRMIGKPLPDQRGAPVRLPILASQAAAGPDRLRLQTRSTLELLQLATRGVDIPEEQLAAGIAARPVSAAARPFIQVHSSTKEPIDPMVGVQYRGLWFWVDSTDMNSKRGFVLMQTLLMRCLEDRTAAQPLLTLPVG